ncbi:hypothetical protein, partial [Xanthomonas graminis]|uniref:hypothetical protein n=1 Tax=Xanthomonas graminis TaxID=3390026 RepID=UPI00195540FD
MLELFGAERVVNVVCSALSDWARPMAADAALASATIRPALGKAGNRLLAALSLFLAWRALRLARATRGGGLRTGAGPSFSAGGCALRRTCPSRIATTDSRLADRQPGCGAWYSNTLTLRGGAS